MIVEGSPYVSYVAEQRISASYRKVHSIAQTFSIVLVQDEIGIRDVHFVGKDAATVSKAYESTSSTSFRPRSIRANKDTPIAQIRGISDVLNARTENRYALTCLASSTSKYHSRPGASSGYDHATRLRSGPT